MSSNNASKGTTLVGTKSKVVKKDTQKETKPYWCTDKGAFARGKEETYKKPKVWYCPGCNKEVPVDHQYPRYMCSDCVQQLVDEEGNPVEVKWNGAYAILTDEKGQQVFSRYVYHLSTDGYWKKYEYKWDKRYGPVVQKVQ